MIKIEKIKFSLLLSNLWMGLLGIAKKFINLFMIMDDYIYI